MRSVVNVNGKNYIVDSTYTKDEKYKTVVFFGNDKGQVSNFRCLYTRTYMNQLAMALGHKRICNNLEIIVG